MNYEGSASADGKHMVWMQPLAQETSKAPGARAGHCSAFSIPSLRSITALLQMQNHRNIDLVCDASSHIV